MSDLDYFLLGNQMWQGVLNKQVTTTPTFTVIDSEFSDPWYNFIVPSVPASEFDWKAAETVMAEREAKAIDFSFYIPSTLDREAYTQQLTNKGYAQLGEEVYLTRELTTADQASNLEFKSAVTDPELYKRIAVELFPDWENAADFSTHLLAKEASTQPTKVANFIVSQANQVIGICAVIFNSQLGYMTNTGVLPQFRGQGLQKKMTSFREKLLLQNGVHNAFAIVDAGTASWQNYINKGYQQWREYLLFTR